MDGSGPDNAGLSGDEAGKCGTGCEVTTRICRLEGGAGLLVCPDAFGSIIMLVIFSNHSAAIILHFIKK